MRDLGAVAIGLDAKLYFLVNNYENFRYFKFKAPLASCLSRCNCYPNSLSLQSRAIAISKQTRRSHPQWPVHV